MTFAGKTVVVTGAGSGIGLALTLQLCAAGARVLALDRRFPAMPEGAECLATNVCDMGELAEAARHVPDGVHGIAAMAGIEMGGRIDELDIAAWHRVFEVNVFGTVRTIQTFLPALLRHKGSIVLCSSQLSLAAARNCPAYAASKGAINTLCRSLAVDHAAEGIRVNAVAPGAIETPMMTRAFRGQPDCVRAAIRARHAMGRFGTADEAAAAAAFLLGDGASFITGAILPVDGGWAAA
ncbi:SDR family NAD(P)-dependent oxidoreductase [Falsirhodobacter xinxiangensis]|uniref:SDR family NAD(P)-dependent oxidoreductase n=1 Tax=Falsirhodobacter xinxiangensis TaxID=2530049 RepID=UPI0010AA1BC8|nr:SDR family oxidoreductase [Rhodobacter xinxiangensis]